jgi:hypothetical protein
MNVDTFIKVGYFYWDMEKSVEIIGENNLSELEPKTVEELEDDKKSRELLLDCYENIKQALEKYMVMEKENYSIVALWILGTYFHSSFPTYPYLFLNAMKGSGKTRLLKLISKFSKNGEILNSLTEAVLFRERGTLCIDEFEGITRQGKESLRELLNSAYKEGTKVKRMKRVKVLGQEQQVVEQFDIYRPISMANIWGMEEVLGDRCITLILEKSNDKIKSKLMEVFEDDFLITTTLSTLSTLTTLKTEKSPIQCRWCRLVCSKTVRALYDLWNNYTMNNTTTLPTLHTLTYTNYTKDKDKIINIFKKISDSEINGRNLELAFPFFLMAFELDSISEEIGLEKPSIFDEILETFMKIFDEKKAEELVENKDILIIDFISQEPETNFYRNLMDLFEDFRKFSNLNEDYINSRWFSKRLKTLNLIKMKRRMPRGIEIIPDYKKAQEKIKMFK